MIKEKQVISLIGFMGTGKSTVGSILAKKMGYVFVDTDELVEKAMGEKITDIFEKYGEDVFREVEHQVLNNALKTEKAIISTGGGIVLFERNRKLLEEKTFVVSLFCEPKTIFDRVKKKATRPLLMNEDPYKKILKILAARQEYYDACDFKISTEKYDPEECSDIIIKEFNTIDN
jgi:shikimate kinase